MLCRIVRCFTRIPKRDVERWKVQGSCFNGWSFERVSTTRVIKMSIRREEDRLANQSRGLPWDGEMVWPLIRMFFNSAPNARNTIKQCARKKEAQREWIPNYKAEKQRKKKGGLVFKRGQVSHSFFDHFPEGGRKECRSLARRKSESLCSLHNILKDLSSGALSINKWYRIGRNYSFPMLEDCNNINIVRREKAK